MHSFSRLLTCLHLVGLTILPLSIRAEDSQATLNLAPPNIKPSDPQVTVAPGQNGAAFLVTVHPGQAKYPSVKIYFQPDKDGYVTSGLLWTPGSAVYYANGKEVLRFETPRIASVPEMMIFTLPCGGWDNNHLDPRNPQLPSDLIIKYVHVYQRKDLASDVDTVNMLAPKK